MGTKRKRLLCILVAVVLAIAMVPIQAGAARAGRSAKVAARRAKATKVDAYATRRGVRVNVKGANPDIQAIDVYRSTAAGELGGKLNADPVMATNYLDRTAAPGVQYYYTVKVAKRLSSRKASSRYSSATDLGQAKASKMDASPEQGRPARLRGASHTPAFERMVKARSRVHATAHRRASTPVARVRATTVLSGPSLTINANTTWGMSMSPVYVRGGDLVVAPGKKLTILPGVKVYFDTFDTYGSEPTTDGSRGILWETNQNPTTQSDLIVHGTLVANGTAAQPILFSSIQASLENTETDPPPSAGYWGSIFFDSMGASQMMNTKVEFGQGIWAKGTTRPYLKSNWLSQNNNHDYDFKPWGSIMFENPVGNASWPQVKIISNHIQGDSTGDGIGVYAIMDTGSFTLNPWIQSNVVKAQHPLDMEAFHHSETATAGNYMLRGTVTGNTLISRNDGCEMGIETTGTGAGTVLTNYVNNTIRGEDGLFIDVVADGSGNADNRPTVTGGTIYSQDPALKVTAESSDITMTSLGFSRAMPVVKGTKMSATEDNCVLLRADSGGSAPSQAEGSFTNVTFETASSDSGENSAEMEDNGVYAVAESTWGFASASPRFANCTGVNHNSGGGIWHAAVVHCEAYCAQGDRLARANPSWTGGRLHAASADGIYNYSQSASGTAQSMAKVSHVDEFSAWGSLVYSRAYGDNSDPMTSGGANASTTWTDSTGWGLEDNRAAIDDYANDGGKGATFANPAITDSAIRGGWAGGPVYAEADSQKGPATASPVITDSTVVGPAESEFGVTMYATIHSAEGVGDATVRPRITRSTIRTSYDDAVYGDAENHGTGRTLVAPIATRSNILETYDDGGFELHASQLGTGTAEVSPFITNCVIDVNDDPCIDVYVTGPGLVNEGLGASYAKANGVIKNTLLRSDWTQGYRVRGDGGNRVNDGGGAESKPRFEDCRFQNPDDYAVDIKVDGWGPAGTVLNASPTILRGSATRSGDGVHVEAFGSSSSSTETAMAAPSIQRFPIYAAFDYGVASYAHTDGLGPATNSTLVNLSPIYSYNGVYTEARSNGSGDALNSSRVLGDPRKRTRLESFKDVGAQSFAYSEDGNATDRAQTKNLSIGSFDSAVSSEAQTDDGTPMTATAMPTIMNNTADDRWALTNYGIYVEAHGDGHAVLKPVIQSNKITNPYNDGIYLYVNGSQTNTATPVLKFNTVSMTGENGIQYAVGGMGNPLGTDSKAVIDFNSISKSGADGISLEQIPYAEIEQNSIVWSHDSGIHWVDPIAATEEMSEIEGNFIKDNPIGLELEGTKGFPKVYANAFADGTFVAGNRPWNIWTDASVPGTISAPGNWWGYTASADISRTIAEVTTFGAVNFAPQRTRFQPKLLSIGVVKTATKIKFTLTFDEPMNQFVRRLTFGPAPGFKAFKVTGSWVGPDHLVWKGTFSPRAAVPTGVWMRFKGAQSYYGAPMRPLDKRFKL